MQHIKSLETRSDKGENISAVIWSRCWYYKQYTIFI